jgi:DNA-binding GntR family transcriptional regulator
MSKLRKEVLSSQIYRALKDMIANYRFSPGSRLNIEKLAKEFGVSRTPIWEAVRRLEQEGLLENIPNRGVFMVEMTLPMALHLYQVREVLEGLAGKLAVNNIDDKILKKMEKCLEDQRKVVEEDDPIGYSKLDFNFHAMIYGASGNPFLQEVLESIKNKMRPLVVLGKPSLKRGYEEHKMILEALRSKDMDRAKKALQQHNLGMQIEIQKGIQRGNQVHYSVDRRVVG